MRKSWDGVCPIGLLEEVADCAERDPDGGLTRVDQLLRSYVADARLHFLKASVLVALDRGAEAAPLLEEALQLEPDFALARFQLGFLELSLGDRASSRATWAPLHELEPRDPMRLFAEGLERLANGEAAQARRLLRQGVAANREVSALNRDMEVILASLDAQPMPGSAELASAELLRLQIFASGARH